MRGCAPSAITRAIKEGRIRETSGRIDPETADREWARHSRARADSRAPSKPSPDSAPPLSADEEAIDYHKARARREHFGAKLAEIEVDKASAALVERSTVESAVFEAFRALRDRIMAAPRRCAPTVAPLSDLREIEAIFADELRRGFEAFEQHISEQLAARMAVK